METKKRCCVTGHRDLPADKIPLVRQRLKEEVARAIAEGFTFFISGMEDGAEALFAEAVHTAKSQHPGLFLEAAVADVEWFADRESDQEAVYRLADGIHPAAKERTEDSYTLLNRYILGQCQRVIAVYDGREEGNTVSFLRHAHVLEKEIVEIRI